VKEISIDNPFVQTWVNGHRVVAYRWSEKSGNLKVIVENNSKYSVLRFFSVGPSLHCSIDVKLSSCEEFMARILEFI
jgi:hypothetical protein